VQHVAGPVASRLGYRRRVAPGRVAAVLAVALVACAGVAACGGSTHATGFCARIQHGNGAFNQTGAAHLDSALAAFDKVAATAPPAVATDLHTVSGFRRELGDKPKSVRQPQITSYIAAVKRVDAYLHDTCGLAIPPPSKIL
jgi:hypothetical protein